MTLPAGHPVRRYALVVIGLVLIGIVLIAEPSVWTFASIGIGAGLVFGAWMRTWHGPKRYQPKAWHYYVGPLGGPLLNRIGQALFGQYATAAALVLGTAFITAMLFVVMLPRTRRASPNEYQSPQPGPATR